MKTFLCCLLLFISSSASNAQDTAEVWLGQLDLKVAKLRLQLEMSEDANARWSGKLISLDQGNAEMKLDSLERDDESIAFTVKKMGIEFDGDLDLENSVIEGTFSQGGQKFELRFEKGDKAKPATHVQNWNGIMKAGGREFDFQFRVFEDEDEKLTGKLDSFSESIYGLHCDIKIGAGNKGVEIDIPATAAKYVGTFTEDMKTINGSWQQSGGEFELNLSHASIAATREPKPRKRPQTPKGPFPYQSEEVTFKNTDAEIELAGTLTYVKSKKSPVVILITGSGPQDRDETIFSHKPFAVIADHLTRNEIAVLRYDERGVEKSTGVFSEANSADLATDVEAAIEFLKTNPNIDSEKIILAGHSEGGLIAPMIAAKRDDVAGVVLLAPPGVNGTKIVLDQSRRIAVANGAASKEDLDKLEQTNRIAFDLLSSEEVKPGKLYEEFKTAAADALGEAVNTIPVEMSIRQLDSPWFRFFATYEPVPALEKTTCPALVLIGKKDLQVDPDLNIPPIEEALEKAGNKDFTVKRLDKLNHLFQECETGSPSEYATIELTFSPKALNLISDWIQARF